jgi:hypothetical protein
VDSFNNSSSHPHAEFAKVLRSYLNHEKRELVNGAVRAVRKRMPKQRTASPDEEVRVLALPFAPCAHSPPARPPTRPQDDFVEEVEASAKEKRPRVLVPPLEPSQLVFTPRSMPDARVDVPQQSDGYNCGVFLLENCRVVYKALAGPRPEEEEEDAEVTGALRGALSGARFGGAQAEERRAKMCKDMKALQNEAGKMGEIKKIKS